MSISRAFTKRVKRNLVDQAPLQRGTTVRYAPGTIDRSLISLPTELISTTNVQALTAPDIRSISGSSSGSVSSGNDSDFSTIDRSFLTSAGNDNSSIDSSGPATPVTPANEDTKSFFDSKQTTPLLPAIASPTFDTPVVPQRAPSHSKKAHVELSRKRSIQRMSPPPVNITQPRSTADSSAETRHPFGRELAQVNEVAEEFGATARLLDEEEQEILGKGLYKFGVEDYLDEIAGLYGGIFEDKLGSIAKPWL
ncbi:uncharacterized protein Z520_02867 [Fonsecaea multimorphosa CBS 102226]|uniref:Uncharacterized protein n=1 Tax=Fonsecaea multimorphosa CBS 102226 TaxID=1442371 RepID=A0A0D2KDK6_9EURO|nr:uncharacterized protein Z520_02867 [Fonsecaea multimorphosa CBS 102226]KIY01315.1 hypothetical protein Z520_02867 [Fonsecaea multimorphosa CBS 102226]OAL28592.1 hypothetical protein AYO22_02786 [Fonsecaea multimorphosa]